MAVTLSALAKELKKHVKVVPIQKKRGLLEQLVFAILLENAPTAVAEYHFKNLEEDFVDFNELRVASRLELVERFTQKPYVKDEKYIHPYPSRTAVRITQSLHWILQKNDGFEIDCDRLKNAAEARTFLSENPFTTRFIVDFVLHFELGYGPIPFDEGARRALRLLALTKPDSDDIRGLGELSRKKTEAENAFWTLHEFGVSMRTGDEIPDEEALKVLYGLDKKANQRSWLALEPCDFDKDLLEIVRSVRSMSRAAVSKRPPTYDENDDETENESDALAEGFGDEDESGFVGMDDQPDTELTQEVSPQPQKGTSPRPQKGDKKVSTKTAGKGNSKEDSPRGRKSSGQSADRDTARDENSSAMKPQKQNVPEQKEESKKPRRLSKKADDSKETKGAKQTNSTKKTKSSQEQPAARLPRGKKDPQRQEELKAASPPASARNAKPTKKPAVSKPAVQAPKATEKPAAEKPPKPKSGASVRNSSAKKSPSPNKSPTGAAASPKKKTAKGKSKK